MKWIQASTYALVSDCGQYAVGKVYVDKMPRYELWRDKKFVSAHKTADAAKDAAEQLRLQPGEAAA